MLNLVLIGPQGSGKGTQAELMVKEYGLMHIEMGKLIRKRAEKHDKKGEIIDHLVNKKGQLLPDGVVLDMIVDEMEEVEARGGYLYDGFPRTVKQYSSLKTLLKGRGMKLSGGLYLKISDEESVKRLGERRNCDKCKKGYSLKFEPEREKCDCGGKLVRRVDDTPKAIKKRLAAFHESTKPILDLMKEDGILMEVDGTQEIEDIFEEIQGKVKELGNKTKQMA